MIQIEDCTHESSIKGTCGQYYPEGPVQDLKASEFICVNVPNIGHEYDSGSNAIKSYALAKSIDYHEIDHSDTSGNNYQIKNHFTPIIMLVQMMAYLYLI